MRIFNCDNWSEVATYATESGNFVGIAIGHESDESTVRLNGVLLQAGRPLMLRSGGGAYRVERITPLASAIPCIDRLQLVAFECAEEVIAFMNGRANLRYSAQSALTAAGGYQRLITVPFVGRRQARFQLHCAAATVDYRIIGITYNAGVAATKETILDTLAGEVPDANSTLAFHVGGTNEAEAWDAIAIEVDLPTDQTTSIDVITIGELGAR